MSLGSTVDWHCKKQKENLRQQMAKGCKGFFGGSSLCSPFEQMCSKVRETPGRFTVTRLNVSRRLRRSRSRSLLKGIPSSSRCSSFIRWFCSIPSGPVIQKNTPFIAFHPERLFEGVKPAILRSTRRNIYWIGLKVDVKSFLRQFFVQHIFTFANLSRARCLTFAG